MNGWAFRVPLAELTAIALVVITGVQLWAFISGERAVVFVDNVKLPRGLGGVDPLPCRKPERVDSDPLVDRLQRVQGVQRRDVCSYPCQISLCHASSPFDMRFGCVPGSFLSTGEAKDVPGRGIKKP